MITHCYYHDKEIVVRVDAEGLETLKTGIRNRIRNLSDSPCTDDVMTEITQLANEWSQLDKAEREQKEQEKLLEVPTAPELKTLNESIAELPF